MGDSIFTDFKARMQIKMAVYVVSAIEVYIQHTQQTFDSEGRDMQRVDLT